MREFTKEEINGIKEEIMNLLNDKKAREAIEIIEYLGYGREMDSSIMKIIDEMTNEYDLYLTKKNRYLNFKDSDIANNFYKGTFMTTKYDYSFVRVSGMDEDIYIKGKNASNAMDGDLVLVKVTSEKTNDRKAEGVIVKVLKVGRNTKLGEVEIDKNKYYCILKNNKKMDKIELIGDDISRLVNGDIITFELLEGKTLKARFKKRICHKDDPDYDIVSILALHDFETSYSDEYMMQLANIPTSVKESDLVGREDLRDEMIFTIDDITTKDIDDAISLKKLPNGHYELGVHIANVPYYIPYNSPIDLDARERSTSVYMIDKVNPMYHHQISNGICSLNPGVDRLTISSIMEIDEEGNMIDYRISESVINSNYKMTYQDVNQILENGEIPKGYEKFADKLKEMGELASIIRQNKIKRGYIDFNKDEVKIVVDSEGNVLNIEKRYRGRAEKMIEDFMILANESVASTITNLGLIGVYRVHGEVSIERLRKFLKFLRNYNIKIKDDFKFVNQKTMQTILKKIEVLEGYQVIVPKLISCMDKAKYSNNNIGHYALASRNYTHFTSPIRRYPDTTIHRLLHDYLFSNLTNDIVNKWENVIPGICEHSSERERAAEECEREADNMKMAEYMESHIGEIHDGVVSGVTPFGIYVTLSNQVEGMIRLSDLDEYFDYDEERSCLIGRNTHTFYTIGTKVVIKVINACKETRQIDFTLYDKEKENEEVSYGEEKIKKIKKKY